MSHFVFLLASIIRFSHPTYHINEHHRVVQPTLVLKNPSSFNITVQVLDVSVTATGKYIDLNAIAIFIFNHLVGGSVDYDSGPYNVTLYAGRTRVSFDVTINDDNIMEDDEEFILIINTDLLPSYVKNGTHITTNVTITRNDGKFITLGDLCSVLGSYFLKVIQYIKLLIVL